MPITARDPFSETAADLAKTEAQGPQPGPSSAEIPVTVHASRYSAASKGAAKLPPVHEETRTVIVFPQGAVVRLSASVTTGELVVLTNNRTGSDVICRVTDVKTQPGIQNYVHLEFTQRALDFWQDPAAAQPSSTRKTPFGSANTAQVMPKATSSQPAPQQMSQGANPSVATAETKPAPIPQITSLADGPAGHSDAMAKSQASKARTQEVASTAAPSRRPPFVASSRPQLQPFESSIPKKNTSTNVIVFAIAAVVLLAVCGVTATILLRQDRGTDLTVSSWNSYGASTPESPRSSAPTDTPEFNSSRQTNAVGQAIAPPSKDPSADSYAPQLAPIHALTESPKPLATEPPKPDLEAHATTQPSPRATLNIGKIAAPKIKTTPQSNAPEPPPALTPEASTLPSAVPETLNTAARIAPVAPPAPAASVPVKGGQLQQPKLLSSVAAIYPPLARSQRLQGDVTIDALVDANGNVGSMRVLNGNALLQNAATDALRRWKYQPATLNGQPIPVHINVTITFRLD